LARDAPAALAAPLIAVASQKARLVEVARNDTHSPVRIGGYIAE
jgi:hypothetical protein